MRLASVLHFAFGDVDAKTDDYLETSSATEFFTVLLGVWHHTAVVLTDSRTLYNDFLTQNTLPWEVYFKSL